MTTKKESMAIKEDERHPEFSKKTVANHFEENLLRCCQCGSCTSECPVVRVSDAFSPEEIIRMVKQGSEERVMKKKSPVWLCTTCYNCAECCPMDVNPTEVFLAMKRIVARRKFLPMGRKMAFSTLAKRGRIFEVKTPQQEERAELGLEPVPDVDTEKTKAILNLTGAYKILAGGK